MLAAIVDAVPSWHGLRKAASALGIAFALAACSGGGAGDASDEATAFTQPPGAPADLWRAERTAVPASGNFVYFANASAGGNPPNRDYLYTATSAVIAIADVQARTSITVQGDENWFGEVALPASTPRLARGYYEGLGRFPFHDAGAGGLFWWGLTAMCNDAVSWLAVDTAQYDVRGALVVLEARFEQRCRDGTVNRNGSDVLRGELRWRADDTTRPPGPASTPPDLWRPSPTRLPATGNVVYLESDAGDRVARGRTAVYTPLDATLSTEGLGEHFGIHVRGEQYWDGNFQAMTHEPRLRVGYYAGLRSYPFHNPARGGLRWYGSEGCGESAGWMAVDAITHDAGGAIASIELRFEQQCAGASGALRGYVRWSAADARVAVGPLSPPPSELWRAAAGNVPSDRNVVWLEGAPGEPILGDTRHRYTQADAIITLRAQGGGASWSVQAEQRVSIEFVAMDSIAALVPGYYPDLRRLGLHNPTRGAFQVQVEGVRCDVSTSWVVVDHVAYVRGELVAVDLRFEHRCEGAAAPLQGQVRWRVDDTTAPPGPVVPPPATLWRASASAVPADGNVVILESTPGDPVGLGTTFLHTSADASFELFNEFGGFSFTTQVGGTRWWSGRFLAMLPFDRLVPGYYPGLRGFPWHNPAFGGMVWDGNAGHCERLDGWFAVDDIAYAGDGSITRVALRFEQQCDGASGLLRGQLRWTAP